MISKTFLWIVACLGVLLGGCASLADGSVNSRFAGDSSRDVLGYFQTISQIPPADLLKERSLLQAQKQNAAIRLRTAVLLGYSRFPQPDLPRAIGILESVLKSTEASAVELHPLARLLSEQYGERLRLDGQFERQALQLKESQRKTVELQEKLEGLADIERTLPRTRSVRPGPARTIQ